MRNLRIAGMAVGALAAAAIGFAGPASADAGPYVPGLHHHHHTWVVTATESNAHPDGHGALTPTLAGSGVAH